MKLALGQICVEGGMPEQNLARAERASAEAAANGAELIVLPEALDCGWTHSSARRLAGTIPGGGACERLRAAARSHCIFICAGMTERAGELLFNAAVLISPEGDVLLHHRKIHELDFARVKIVRGDRLAVTQTSLGTIGLMICADAFAPDLCITRTLGVMGAKLILSPCAWAVPIDHDQSVEPYGKLWLACYGPVARDPRLTMVGVSNVGPLTDGAWAGRQCIGCSLVVGPNGTPVLQGPYGSDAEALLFTEIAEPKNNGQSHCENAEAAITQTMSIWANES